MFEGIISIIKRFVIPILDILLVAYIFYRLILLIKGTRAVQILTGIIILAMVTFLAGLINFSTLKWFLEKFWLAGAVILVVVFQPELRALLAQIGSPKITNLLFSSQTKNFVDEIVEALKKCSLQKIGTIIVVENQVGLKEFIETGTIINAEIKKELILSIFSHLSPLHDGAVIIQNDRIVAAGCVLPLTNQEVYQKIFGMRHQAAVGITEVSDAWAIVVSEETGMVSLAINGELDRNIQLEDLKKRMIEEFISEKKFNFVQSKG